MMAVIYCGVCLGGNGSLQCTVSVCAERSAVCDKVERGTLNCVILCVHWIGLALMFVL
jgi:cytidine deaminase